MKKKIKVLVIDDSAVVRKILSTALNKYPRYRSSKTIAQDKDSCVVFGMPNEAIKLGAGDKIAPLQKIPDNIFAFLNN